MTTPTTMADGVPERRSPVRAPMHLAYSAVSDVGRVRKENQDSGYVGPHLVVICDGVGGAARGDVASSTAVAQIRKLDQNPPPPGTSEADLLGLVSGAMHRAQDRIAELVDDDPALDGTSTTATIALFDGERMGIGHVGDSRGYLFRDGAIRQITTDHTFVQSLIDEGRITEDEARVHPHKNLILRAIDGKHELDPDLFVLDVEPGDRLLLCSDGASGVLSAGRLADILSSGSPDYAATELVRASLDAGSSDNVTCLVADVLADALADAAATSGDATDRDGGATTQAATPTPQTGPDAVPDTVSVRVPSTALLVGAAAEMRRRRRGGQSTSLFRGHRAGDTGELEPVAAEILGAMPGDLAFAIDSDPVTRPRTSTASTGTTQPGAGRRWTRRVLMLLLLVGVAWIGLSAIWSWSQHRYYVGQDRGTVVIYRGVNASILGLAMSTPYERTNVTLARLSDFDASQIADGIGVDDLGEAHRTVNNLATRMSTDTTGDGTASPSASASAPPSASASTSPSTSASTSPTPSTSPSVG